MPYKRVENDIETLNATDTTATRIEVESPAALIWDSMADRNITSARDVHLHAYPNDAAVTHLRSTLGCMTAHV
jgi:hypothetical protein